MTWSIVARDPEAGAFAVAITTRAFAVGARCPFAESAVGALSTQALSNPFFGRRGLTLLREGVPAADVVRLLTLGDTGREHRQVHAIDRHGATAAWTGVDCIPWCGHATDDDVSVAGNMLSGPEVVAETMRVYRAGRTLPLADRLLRALEAGQAAGGDKRGRQSAALLIFSGEEYAHLDLRVDDHPDPLVELRRLYQVSEGRYAVMRRFTPSRANPAGITDWALIEAAVAEAEGGGDRGVSHRRSE
ncbi:pilus assembly protein [Allostella sp. ATCC 35155]|nr:pilus assembly protein [Stella sp. ATCC 35155]